LTEYKLLAFQHERQHPGWHTAVVAACEDYYNNGMKSANSETLEMYKCTRMPPHVVAHPAGSKLGGQQNTLHILTDTQHHQLASGYMAAHCNAFQPQSYNSSSKSSV
jgi:hypothetical protein